MLRFSVLVALVFAIVVGGSPLALSTEQFEFTRSSWSAFNITHEGKKYCVVGVKPIRASQGFDASKVTVMYTPQIQLLSIVNEEQEFRAKQGYLSGRYESYRMLFAEKGGFLWPQFGGDRFDQIALESPRMKIRAGQIWVEFRNTGFKNAFENAAQYCGVTYSLPLP